MKKFKKIFGGVLTVFVLVTQVLGGITPSVAMALGDSEKNLYVEKNIKISEVTEEISEERKWELLKNSISKDKVEDIGVPNEDEEVWVIVQMENESLIEQLSKSRTTLNISEFAMSQDGQVISDNMVTEQNKVKDEIKARGIEVEYKQSYTSVFNGFSAKVKYCDVEAIKNIPMVKDVILSTLYYLDEVNDNEKVENLESINGLEDINENEEGIDEKTQEEVVEESDNSEGQEMSKDNSLDSTEDKSSEEGFDEEEEITVENIEKDIVNEDESTVLSLEEEGVLPQYTGSGMVITIIDTGLDYNHSAFQKIPLSPRMDKNHVNNVLPKTYAYKSIGCSVDDVYYSPKIPYMFDYADMDTNVAPTKESVDRFGNDHGTHVAGISAGNDNQITGVAPDAQLIIMKAFSDNSVGAKTIDILASLNDAVLLGTDIINMSLGSSGGFASEKSDELISQIYSAVSNGGINLTVSAGNAYSSTNGSHKGDLPISSNPDTGLVGSPSSYNASTSVASIEATPSKYFLVGDSSIVYAEVGGHDFAEELTESSYEYVVVPGAGKLTDYEDIDVAGKIALVKRGSISFNEKQLNAASKGAVGCIIYNNRSGYLLNMSIDEYTIPTVAISLEDGEILEKAEGKLINIPTEGKGDILMSDFSSWGPLPSLELKPEITAPGGNVYSSLPFQSYGYKSGTSMAAPWLAGASSIVKQYLKADYKNLTYKEMEILVNRLLMSTATPALNPSGNMYSPRKQGAGVASIEKSINAPAYLYVYGEDKSKLELGDDKSESGVYNLSFHIKNMSQKEVSYNVSANAMTETIAADGITMAQKPYVFNDAAVEIPSVKNGVLNGNTVTVGANGDCTVTVKVTLSEADKEYMRRNFENGIYVEGFVSLEDTDVNGINLSIPYLSFFGDWTKAPILDSNIFDDDAPYMMDSYPVSIYAMFFALRLGTYLFDAPEGVEEPAPSVDKIAIGLNKGTGMSNIGFTALGLLRGAKEVSHRITDKATGKVLSEYKDTNIRKSILNSGSGAVSPSYTGTQFPAYGQNLPLGNNSVLNYSVEATLDYKDPQNNKNSSWEFPIYIDYENPVLYPLTAYTKDGRNLLDVELSDNHKLMAVALYSYTEVYDKGVLVSMPGSNYNEYMTPLTNEKADEKVSVTFDVTDIHSKFYKNRFYVIAYDYAMNESIYLIELPPVKVTGITLDKSEASMKINEVLKINPSITPDNATNKNIIWTSSDDSIAKVLDGEVTSISSGNVTITATTEDGGFKAQCEIRVTNELDNPIIATDIALNKNNMTLVKGQSEELIAKVLPDNTTDKTITWTSSDEQVATVEAGVVTAVGKGTAEIIASVVGGAKSSCSVNVVEPVGNFIIQDNILTGYSGNEEVVIIPEGVIEIGEKVFLKNTSIKKVVIPNSVKAIGKEAFRDCTSLLEVVMPESLQTLSTGAFNGCTSLLTINIPGGITRIESETFYKCTALANLILPDGITFIGDSAFRNCKSIESIVLPDSVTTLENFVFSDCTKLKEVTLSKGITELPQSAFMNCIGLENIDLINVTKLGGFSFQNSGLKKFTIPSQVTEVARRTFALCKELQEVTFEGNPIVGDSLFYDNDKLTSVKGNLTVITEDMFKYCDGITSFVIPKTVNRIDEGAFEYCKNLTEIIFTKDSELVPAVETMGIDIFNNCPNFTKFTVEEGNKYASVVEGILYDKEVKFMAYVPTGKSLTVLNMPNTVEVINQYAFNKKTTLTAINFSENLKEIGGNAFFGCTKLTNLSFPTGLEKIGSNGFSGCTGITELNFKEGLKEIGERAFYNSSSKVKSIVLPDTTKVIGNDAFYGCTSATIIDVGDGVETIGSQAFYNCKSVLTISLSQKLKSVGDKAFYECNKVEDINFKDSIETIGNYAFYKCFNLDAINLPDTVTTIGEFAFYEARGLKELKLSEGLVELSNYVFGNMNSMYTYYQCEKPVNLVKIPASVEKISPNSFFKANYLEKIEVSPENKYYASTLEGILIDLNTGAIHIWPISNMTEEFTIPNTMNSIGKEMFRDKKNIKKVTVPGTVNHVGTYAFFNSSIEEIIFEDSTNGGLVVEASAFENCKELVNIQLPKGTTDIKERGFKGCIALESIILPDTITSLGKSLFEGNSSLKEVKLPERLKKIDSGVFKDCNSLTSLNIPPSVADISFSEIISPFEGCTAIESINVDENNKHYKSIDGVVYNKAETELYYYPGLKTGTSYEVPEGVARIEERAFNKNLNLTEVKLPSTLQRIGDAAFLGCYNLKTYDFNSINAPLLEVKLNVPVFNLAWYGNFYDRYFTWDNEYNMVLTDMELNMFYPAGGSGYDTKMWDIFFRSKTETTLENMLSVNNLEVTADNSHNAFLTWNAAPWAEGYKVERALVTEQKVEAQNIETSDMVNASVNHIGDFELLGKTDGTSFTDINLYFGNTYMYKVTAYMENEEVYGPSTTAAIYIEPINEDEAIALTVVNMIKNIKDTVTLEDKQGIVEVRAAYESLTDIQKGLVYNYSKLVLSEEVLAILEKEAADKAAAKIVIDMINELPKIVKVEDEEAIEAARAAYEALTEEQKSLVDNYASLEAAEKALEEAKKQAEKEAADKAAAKVVIDMINGLPEIVKVEDEEAIEVARAAYEALTEEQKSLVDNYANLEAAEKALEEAKKQAEKEAADKAAAKIVIDMINELPKEVKVQDEEVIVATRTAYEALTEEQKVLVDNYDNLEEAEKALEAAKKEVEKEAANKAANKAAAKVVIDMINALPTQVKVEDEGAIAATRTAYEALTEEQKSLVDNYGNLVAAEKALEEAKKQAEKEAADKAAAKVVIDMINGLPKEVKIEDKDSIKAARKAYDNLNNRQKSLVTNYDKLKEAEKALEEIEKDENIEKPSKPNKPSLPQTGAMDSGDFMAFSGLVSIGISFLFRRKENK